MSKQATTRVNSSRVQLRGRKVRCSGSLLGTPGNSVGTGGPAVYQTKHAKPSLVNPVRILWPQDERDNSSSGLYGLL